MIKERYCSYEVAKLLKEKGFDEDTVFVWYEHLPKANAVRREDVGKPKMEYFYLDETSERNFKFHNFAPIPPYINGKVYSAPTHQMACDWLREEKGILIEIEHRNYDSGTFRWTVYSKRNTFPKWVGIESDISNSYGEAIEAALKYSLENLV